MSFEPSSIVAGGGGTIVNSSSNNKAFHMKIDNKTDVNDIVDGVTASESQQHETISYRNLKEKNCESLSDNSSEGNRHDGIFKNGVPDLGKLFLIGI